MKKTPLVFSITKEQSLFMTALLALMSFLAVLSLGVALMIGTSIARWDAQWDLFATVQVMPGGNVDAVQKILDNNAEKFSSVQMVSSASMKSMLRPWVGGNSAIENYLPKMFEVHFNKKSDIENIKKQTENYARFMTHGESVSASRAAGWRIMLISALVLGLVISAIGFCISFIAKNTARLHKRELEIVSQVGAKDNFVARQMQRIVGKIAFRASALGFVAASPILLFIVAALRTGRVGLMAMAGLAGGTWIVLALLPVVITIAAIIITRKTTLGLLGSPKNTK